MVTLPEFCEVDVSVGGLYSEENVQEESVIHEDAKLATLHPAGICTCV